MQFLDKLGWPVETFKGRPITNAIRLLIHCRKIKRGKFEHRALAPDPSVQCEAQQPPDTRLADAVRKARGGDAPVPKRGYA